MLDPMFDRPGKTVGPDRATVTQLGLIAEVSGILGGARIRFWLRGGWALDFLQGHVRRSHADVDVVTWLSHAHRVRSVLMAHGYRSLPTRSPHLKFRKLGQEVSVVFVQRDSLGRIRGVPEDWGWSPASLSERRHRLGAVSCRIVTPAQLLAEKLNYERNTGRPLRKKDRRSISELQKFLRL